MLEEVRKKKNGNPFEKMTRENFPKLVKEIDIQVQKVQKVANKMTPKRPTPRNLIIKMPKVKDKERILKTAKEKQLVTKKGAPIRLSADFSKDTCRLEGIGKKYSKS